MVETQMNTEASSSSRAVEETDSDIQKKFKQIREKNEEIKNEVYSKLLKEKPRDKDKLVTAFDYSTIKMIMSFLQPMVTDPRSATDYRKTEFEVNADAIHELDQIEFRRSASKMLYSKVVSKTMNVTMLQKTVSNLKTQMKLDKASLHAKDLRIKS